MQLIKESNKGFAGFVRNNAVIALAMAILIVGVLFYSVPAFAFWVDSSTSLIASQTGGSPTLTVTARINKMANEHYNLSAVTGKLLYHDGTISSPVTARVCTFSSSWIGYGYLFNSYGYIGDLTRYAFGYRNGYGLDQNAIDCVFDFTIKDGGVATGITTVVVNDYMLGNDQFNPGVTSFLFPNGQTYAYKQFTAGSLSDQVFPFYMQNGSNIANVTMLASTSVNGSSSGVWNVSLDIIPALGDISASRVNGFVLLFGPANTNFSPNLSISIYYGQFNSTAISNIESLDASGKLQILKCTSAGASCSALTYTINTTTNVLNFTVGSFSTITVFDGTPTPKNGGGSGGGSTGGGEVGLPGGYVAPPPKPANDTPPAPPPSQVPTQPPAPTTPTVTPEPTLPLPDETTKSGTNNPEVGANPPAEGGNAPAPLDIVTVFTWIIGVLLAIAVIGGVAFFLMQGRKGKGM